METEGDLVRKIHGHLLIRDINSAVEEGKRSFLAFPESEPVNVAYVRALCAKGDEVEAFNCVTPLFKKELSDAVRRELTEFLGWGVLSKANGSSLITARLHALLGAAFTGDAKAIPILLKELRGSNGILRSLAAQLSASCRDQPLRQELLHLLESEKVWFVRLEVIRALGALKETKARPFFREVLASPQASIEEKQVAAISLVSMYDEVQEDELKELVSSDRAGLRLLASEIVAHLSLKDKASLLKPLLVDASPAVRVSAMNTLGLLQVRHLEKETVLSLLSSNLSHSVPAISITAGWLALVLGEVKGEEVLSYWLKRGDPGAKRLAASAIAATGGKGVALAKQSLKEEEDPCARVNLALGLIGQRVETSQAADVLLESLSKTRGSLLMWDDRSNPLFSSLSLRDPGHGDQALWQPSTLDQLARLRLLAVLTVIEHPKAPEMVREFVEEMQFSSLSLSALFLLGGEKDSLQPFFQKLLEDEEEKVRLFAALVLSSMGGGEGVVEVLKESYPAARREMKVYILEALSRTKDPELAPFFIEALKEPFQVVRVLAASALIQSLYH